MYWVANKLFKWDKLQLASSAALHILANYNLPLNRALYTRQAMKTILSLLLLFPFFAYPCGENKKSELTSFAKIDETDDREDKAFYEVFIPSKYDGSFLTSFELLLPSSVSVTLKVSGAFGYEGFDSVSFHLNPELIDVVKLKASYSSNEDKTGFTLCGNVMEFNLRNMLVAEQPKLILPPPPSAMGSR